MQQFSDIKIICTPKIGFGKSMMVTYLDPWIMSARSLVIFPDSTTPTQAASSFSVNSKSFALSSSLALKKLFIQFFCHHFSMGYFTV